MWNTKHIVLIHGLGAHGISLHLYKKAFKALGYKVHVWSYYVTKRNIEDVVKVLNKRLNKTFTEHDTVSFVGHSLGGILIKGILHYNHYCKVHRIVTIGTPHHGTLSANFSQKYLRIPFRYYLGYVFDQLHWKSTDLYYSLPKGVEVGGIGSNVDRKNLFNPFAYILNGYINDGLVELNSTYVDGMTDFIVTQTDHVSQLWHKETIDATVRFIQHGKF